MNACEFNIDSNRHGPKPNVGVRSIDKREGFQVGCSKFMDNKINDSLTEGVGTFETE